MKNKLMILLIIVLLTSFATAFEMDLGGLQDNNTRSQTQQAMAPQQTAQEQSSSRMDFTDMLADDTSESIIEITSQLEDTLPEPITEPVIDTGIDEFGLAGKLSDSNFETEIAEMLQDTKTPKATSEQEDDLFNNLAGRLKDPDKKVPGKVVGILKSDNTEAEHNTKILQRSKGKIDLKINFTRTDDNNTLLEKHAGAIREIVIKGHDERSPKNMLKIEQNLPRNITPFKSRGSFAIDPTQMNFTEMTLTFKASGSALYKCKAWNFTTKTCAPVQRDCTGEGKNQTCIVTGGWTKIMSLVPGRTYTLNITPEDPAFAQYNSTLGAPECADGESPCTATSALLQSRDNIGGTVEPNQPNTIDACTDGASGTYLTDESVENITVESLNGSYFRQGDTIRVNATFLCWNTANDNLNWVYTNTTTAPGWSVKAFTDPCPVARPNFYQGSHTWTLDNNAGKHAVRIINQYNGNTATTCGGGAYDDNDDVAFRVYTRVPPNVTNLTPVANTTYDVNDNVTVSARVEDDETRIRYVKANITLPDGTSVLVNLSRKVIGEVLENRTINGSWRTLNFTNTYDDPVVFASPLPLRDLRPAEVRIVNVTSTGFTVRAQEPTGDFPEADNHSNEWPISILVFETGVHKLSDGSYIEVHKNLSTTTVSGTGPDAWTTYSYNINFSATPGTPVLLAQVQTYNSPRFVATAVRNLNNATFQMSMEVAQDNASAHPNEVIGWAAIIETTNSTLNQTRYSAIRSPDTIQGYTNGCYATAHGLGTIPAAVTGNMQTRDGGNGGWSRYCTQTSTWTTTNTYWTIDEVDNGERSHTTERVGYLAFTSEANLTDDRYWEIIFNQTQQRGRYNITFIASDIPYNINDTETTYFIIPTYPNVTLVSPPNATVQNITSATFICNATDTFGLKNITFYLWNSTGGLVQSNTTIVSGKKNQSNITTTMLQGTYYWNCLATTVYGLSASAPDNYTLIIDITDPVVNISSPVNGTTYNTTINLPLNFTATNGVAIDSCWYVLNAGAAVPIPGCANTTINVSAGQNNLTVYANDTAGNIGNDSVTFIARWATTMLINTTKNPVENGERFYYYADYEYAHNSSDVLGATCTVEQLNATDVSWHNGLDDSVELFNTTSDYYATKLDNLPASFIANTYMLQIYLALNSTGNKNLRIWVVNNESSWNSSQPYNDTINTTTNPELNTTVQLINKTLSPTLFATSENYTIIVSCDDCNSTDYYALGKDTDNFGHSYEAHGTPITWSNMSLDAFEHMMGILLTIKPIPLIYNSTNSRYERSAVQYLYSSASEDYTYRINCSKALHVPQTNKSTLTVANNYIPQPNITSIVPDPARAYADNVQVMWANDASGKAFGITTSYVNLTDPDGNFVQQYQGNPFTISKNKLTKLGNYTLTAFAENSQGSNTSNKTFLVISTAPNVTIIAPLGENYSENTIVVISTNVTDPDGIDTVIASVDSPNGSQYNITLNGPITSDNFDNSSTLGTKWINITTTGPGQTCVRNINSTIPGRAFANLTGSGFPKTFTVCAIGSDKRVDGNFDLNVTWYWEAAKQYADGAVGLSLAENQVGSIFNRQLFIWYGNFTGVGTAIEIYGNDNGTLTRVSRIPIYLENATMRATRIGNNFTFYNWNATAGNWTKLPMTKSIWNLSRALHVHMGAVAQYPGYGSAIVSADNFSIVSENTTFGLFNKTSQLGLYNITIIANDTLGGINNSEKTNFTIVFVNDPPSKPYILAPYNGQIVSGQFNITWLQVQDPENNTLEYNITLLNPDYTINQTIVSGLPNTPFPRTQYLWDTTTIPDGVYSIRVTVYENNTPEKLSNTAFLTGNFTLVNTRPNVTIIAPLDETFGENTTVVISANVTDSSGIDKVIASVDSPNGSQYNITLGKSFESQDFGNSSDLNTTWLKISDIGPSQTCKVDINTTIPGRIFTNLSGSGLPKTLTLCGARSNKRVDGNFDINISFWWEEAVQGTGAGMVWTMTDSKTAGFGNKQIMIYYGNVSGVGPAFRVYANDNGTTSVISQVPIYVTNGSARIVRQANNFSVYLYNATAGNWTPLPLTRNYWNLSRALYAQIGVASVFATYSTAAASADNFNIISENTTFGLFNRTEQLGIYNFTIIANNTYGNVNNSETSNFTIKYINDGPSTPFILTPDIGTSAGGQSYNISWLPVTDPEGHTLQYNITLLNPNFSVNATIVTNLGPSNRTTYTWNTTLHNDGVYSMRITVFENNTVEKLSNSYTMPGTFTINNQQPSVIILAPLGQTFDQNSTVVISTNITSVSPIATAMATVYSPNGSQYNVTLEKGLQSNDFDNSSSINTTWIKTANIAGSQICTADINATIPGRGFANLSGNGFPNTISLCGIGSMKRIDGDFDINTTWYWEAAKQGVDSGLVLTVSESKIANFANRQLLIYYGNISGVGTATRIYANDNGTMQVISQVNKYLSNNSLRIVRVNNTFTIYSLNQSSGNWTQIPTLKPVLNLSRALHVQIGVASMYSAYSTAAASAEEINIQSDNTPFGLFNKTSQQGNYNTSIYVRDAFGGVNNSEKTNFSINYTNNPPSVPFLLKPDPGDVWSLFNYIAWIQTVDPEGHSVKFNITLLNPNYTYNSTIASNWGNISQTLYLWNTSTVPDGIYSLNVKVFENATPEKLSQSSTLPGNFTINNYGPKVFNLTPINGSTFPSNTTVLIGANVTDIAGVDTVLVNVTLPDNTIQQIKLNYTAGNWYELNFTNTILDGIYKAKFIANDTYGKINDTEITFFVIPNDAPNITVNGPANGSNYTMNVFNITVNLTVTDKNNDSLCVKVFASNETPIVNESYHLLARIGACYNQSTETIIYNWTSPVIQPDSNTVMLLHFDYDTSLGENTTHMYDFSGNGNNASCTPGSCPTYVSGKIGAAMLYAPGEYVAVQDSPTLDGMNEISIETWINVSDISDFNIIDKNQSYEIYTDVTGHVIFKLFSPNVTVKSTSTLQINKWHMIQATYNGSEMKLYLDGVLENTSTRAGAVANTTGPLTIGIDAGDLASNGFEGIIDQVVVHNTSLAYNTIRNHYRLKNGTWYWYVRADDFINSTESGEYHININVNKKPSITQVILNSTSGSNLPIDNLTRYVINATDADGNEIKNITDWRVNNKSYAVLNMPFEANNWNETAWTKDFTKNKNDGKVYDADWQKRGGYDGWGAYEFTGQQKIRVSHRPSLNISKEITMEAWIYPTQFVADGIIYAKPHTSFVNPFIIYGLGYSSSNLRYDLALADGATQRNCPSSNNAVKLNTWQHIAATFNGTTTKLYIDGKLNSSCNFTEFNISTNSMPLYLGHYPYQNNQYSYKGKLDEVKIYNRTLSAQQINALYNNRTDQIVSQETTAGETWQACATPNDRRENGAQVCSNNLTIAVRPKVYPDQTLDGAKYFLNETAILRANITSPYLLDTVYANVTLPNGTTIRVNLTNVSAITYEANFTNLLLRGIYNITFFANNTAGFANASETSYFDRISLDIIDILTGNMTQNVYADYSTTVLQNTSGVLDLNITINSTRVPSIILYNHSENSMHSVIRLSDYTNEDTQGFADSGWAIDLTGINMTYANVTAYTDGNHLLKCTNMSWTTLQCADEFEYTYVKDVQNGTTYNILLNASDPIFITTIIGNNSINDTTLVQQQPNTNYGALTAMRVGRAVGAATNFRSLIRFNLTGIPQGAVINSARLGLYFFRIPGADSTANRTYNIFKVQQNPARDWIELQATTNNYTSAATWTNPGGDFVGTPTDSINFNSSSLNSFVYWDVTSDVQNFSDNRNLDFGWIIADNQSAGNTRRDFRSKEVANAALRPVLLLNYTEYTALLAARTNFTPFTFSSSAYVPVFTILFNTTMNQTNITMLSSFNIEKTTGTGIDIISAKVYLDGVLVATDPDIRTAAIGEPQTAGIIPIMQNVTNGTHNITVAFERTGNGNVKVSNIDFNIIEMTSAKGGNVRGQITPANYQHTAGGTGYPYAFNWTINRTCPGNAFVTSKGTHSSTGVNTAISYKFIDKDTLEESPTWEAVTLNSSDVHSMSGNWLFYNQIAGVNNMSVGSRNYQAGRTTTVNMTIFDASMNDCAKRTIHAVRTTSNLTNWSTALTINDTWTKIVAHNVTMKYGTGLFASFTSTPQLVGGDPNAQNLTQRITVRGPGANCTIEKRLGLFGALDAGNLYVYTVCENLTVGQTYEIAGWGKAGAGRTYNQYDEAISTFEINPKPVEQIQLETRPDLEPINLTFSDNNPKENQNITITATVINNGASASDIPVAFYDGNCTNGTQINGNKTILQLNKSQTTTVNVTWIASPVGPHNIYVCVDPNNIINESNETNNNLNNTLNVQAWQLYYGRADGNLTLQKTTCELEYSWLAIDNGTIYITDIDDSFNFPFLQALGRNITGGPSTNDFAEADALLNMTGFNDSVQILFAVNASVPKQTTTFTIINREVQNVPYINSTNTSNFITGILWDTRNDTDGQYGTVDNETLVFVANINRNATGKYGTYDYEIYIPRNLAKYSGLTDRVRFYTELR